MGGIGDRDRKHLLLYDGQVSEVNIYPIPCAAVCGDFYYYQEESDRLPIP